MIRYIVVFGVHGEHEALYRDPTEAKKVAEHLTQGRVIAVAPIPDPAEPHIEPAETEGGAP